MPGLSEDEVARIAQEAAKAAVAETFLALGLDVSTPASIIELQEYFANWRRSRDLSRLVARYGITVTVGTVITGALAVLWLGLTSLFKSGAS